MQTGELEVVCPGSLRGVLDVLAIGKGDMRMVFGPEDAERAKKVIETMMQAGYGIFVETDDGLARVKRFNAKRMTYVITESVEAENDGKEEAASAQESAPKKRGRRHLNAVEREVEVAGSKATAIGRTSGGC